MAPPRESRLDGLPRTERGRRGSSEQARARVVADRGAARGVSAERRRTHGAVGRTRSTGRINARSRPPEKQSWNKWGSNRAAAVETCAPNQRQRSSRPRARIGLSWMHRGRWATRLTCADRVAGDRTRVGTSSRPRHSTYRWFYRDRGEFIAPRLRHAQLESPCRSSRQQAGGGATIGRHESGARRDAAIVVARPCADALSIADAPPRGIGRTHYQRRFRTLRPPDRVYTIAARAGQADGPDPRWRYDGGRTSPQMIRVGKLPRSQNQGHGGAP